MPKKREEDEERVSAPQIVIEPRSEWENKSKYAGRPTKWTPELEDAAIEYVNGGWTKKDVVPSIEGMACEVGVSKQTLYNWANQKKGVFLDVLEALNEIQARTSLNGGVSGAFNPPICKMLLSKHGYQETTVIDNRSSDGSMTPASQLSPEEAARAFKEEIKR